jgi:hypothetical protein
MDPTTKSWIIPLTFLFNRSNGKTKSKKMKPFKMLINEDVTMIAWLLGIKECKQSIENEGHKANTNQANNIPKIPNNS